MKRWIVTMILTIVMFSLLASPAFGIPAIHSKGARHNGGARVAKIVNGGGAHTASLGIPSNSPSKSQKHNGTSNGSKHHRK